jgi:hypothetical protein
MNSGFKAVAAVCMLLAAAALCFWLSFSFQGLGRALLICLTALVAMPAIAVLFGPRVLGGVLAIAASGALFGGSLWLADSTTVAVQVIGFIFAYITWLGFSACVFGVPVIVLPFPPFFIFAWQQLSAQQKRDMWLRFLAIAILVVIASGVAGLRGSRTQRPAENSHTDIAARPIGNSLPANMQRAIQAVLNEKENLNIRELKIAVSGDRAVTLIGVAPTAATRQRAEEVVANLPGVTQVINELLVE